MTKSPGSIVVGVPTWRGSAFVAETLQSVLRQRDVRLMVFISIDGPDAASEEACRPFLADPRVTMAVQAHRVGWVANTAIVLAAALSAGVDYACVQPHDDLMADDYLGSLLDVAEAAPEAAVVFSDIACFGAVEMNLQQPSVMGSTLERHINLNLHHFNAIAYRGLTRASALARVAPISGNAFDDFAADTIWMTRLATIGELIRVPRVLYRKRYHGANTHVAWNGWPRERKVAAWARHCLDMLREAFGAISDRAERERLIEAARTRLLQFGDPAGIFPDAAGVLSHGERAQLLASFDSLCGEEGLSAEAALPNLARCGPMG